MRNYLILVAQKVQKFTLCPGHKHLSTAANTTNLIKHLKRQHANSPLVSKDQRSDTDADTSLPLPTPAKQPRLDFQQQVTKSELNRLVGAYIVEEMLPVSTVESSSFRNILAKIPVTKSGRTPSDRKKCASYLDQCYVDIKTFFVTIMLVTVHTADRRWTHSPAKDVAHSIYQGNVLLLVSNAVTARVRTILLNSVFQKEMRSRKGNMLMLWRTLI